MTTRLLTPFCILNVFQLRRLLLNMLLQIMTGVSFPSPALPLRCAFKPNLLFSARDHGATECVAYRFSRLPRLPRLSSGSNRLSSSGRRLYFRLGLPSGSEICPEEPENTRDKQFNLIYAALSTMQLHIRTYEVQLL